jgi:hypothetical protein
MEFIMTAKIDLKEIERRANYAAFQDGLMEILMGLVLIFFGGAMASKGTLTPFIVFVIFFANPVLKRVKERYIFPRVGYVKLPQEEQTDTKGIGIAALIFVIFLLSSLGISIWIMGVNAGRDFWMRYILPPFTGFMMAFGPFWLGQTYGLVRGYVFAAIFLILGIVIPLFGFVSGYEAVGLICSIQGIIILITGLIMFTRFLRRYPPVQGELFYEEGESPNAS